MADRFTLKKEGDHILLMDNGRVVSDVSAWPAEEVGARLVHLNSEDHDPERPIETDDGHKMDPSGRWLVDCCGDAIPCSAQTLAVNYGSPSYAGHPAEYCGDEATQVIDGEPVCNKHVGPDDDYERDDWDDR